MLLKYLTQIKIHLIVMLRHETIITNLSSQVFFLPKLNIYTFYISILSDYITNLESLAFFFLRVIFYLVGVFRTSSLVVSSDP